MKSNILVFSFLITSLLIGGCFGSKIPEIDYGIQAGIIQISDCYWSSPGFISCILANKKPGLPLSHNAIGLRSFKDNVLLKTDRFPSTSMSFGEKQEILLYVGEEADIIKLTY